MNHQKTLIEENSLYRIETIDSLALITFNSKAPIEEFYKLESSHTFFTSALSKISGKDINTRLFLFSDNMFEETRFEEFFKTIKISEDKKVDFLSNESNIRLNEFSRFVNIKHRFINEILASDKINIIASNGSSIGLWISTLFSADFTILTEGSQFTFPFLKDDIFPLGGLIYYLHKHVNKAAIGELFLLGSPITTQNLLDWGLVNRVFSPESFEEKSIEQALEISRKSSGYIKNYKVYKHRFNRELKEYLDLEREFYTSRGV